MGLKFNKYIKSVIQFVINLFPDEKQEIYLQKLNDMRIKAKIRNENNRKFKEFTGGYSKIATMAILVSIVISFTPLCKLGLLLVIFSSLCFTIDLLIKTIKFNIYLNGVTKNI